MARFLSVLCMVFLAVPLFAAEPQFASAVTASKPVAYYRLTSAEGKSKVGGTTYKSQGGATMGPGIFGADSQAVMLNGKDAYILTTQSGGVAGAASIMLWVNLNDLPSDGGHVYYLAGESQEGNDLDLQIETDNILRFYTAAGGNLEYHLEGAGVVQHWHMVVATLNTPSQTRALYWDGKQVASDRGSGRPNKSGTFSVGESTVFHGRYLNGSVEEAALWNRALSSNEVAALYSAATSTAPSGAPSNDLFPNSAKVTLEGPSGPLAIKPEEKTAFLFVSGVQLIESDCQFKLHRACSFAEVLSGVAAPNGQRTSHLKYDPRTDPNYTYSVGALDMAWEVHATPKKPGFMGFFIWGRGMEVPTIVYNPGGAATTVDRQFRSSGVEGDSFQVQ